MADVYADLKNWSATASSNLPAGTTTIGTGLDDNLRQIQATVVQDLSNVGADIASAATCDLGAVPGLFHTITGTTGITSFGTVRAGIWKVLTFSGAVTITYNATSMITPDSADLTTVAKDSFIAESLGSGNWKVHPLKQTSLAASTLADGTIATTQSVGDSTTKVSTTAFVQAEFADRIASRVRVEVMNGYGSSNTSVMRFTNTTINAGTDITYADSASNGGSFTINTSGVYAVTLQADFSTGSARGITVNGSNLSTNIDNVAQTIGELVAVSYSYAASPLAVSAIHYFTATDIVRAQANGNTVGTFNKAFFEIVRLA